MPAYLYLFHIMFAFFIVELCRLLLNRNKGPQLHGRQVYLLVPIISAVWMGSIIGAYYSQSEAAALFWFRLSYAILLPAPLGNQWLCFQLMGEKVPRLTVMIAIVATFIVSIATFLTPWVVSGVKLDPFVPVFGVFYPALSLLTLFHAVNAYMIARKNLGQAIVFDKESDFANRLTGLLMIILTSMAFAGGFVLPWLMERRLLPHDFPFLIPGIVVLAAYYLLSRYIFWRLNDLSLDDPFEWLSKKASKFLQTLVFNKQAQFREDFESFLKKLESDFDIDAVLKNASLFFDSSLLLEFSGADLKIYGNAVKFLRLQVTADEWRQVTAPQNPLITSKLSKSHPAIFKKLVSNGSGAIFPVLDHGGKCIGQLKFDLRFSHRFLYKQDYDFVRRFCDRLGERHLAQSRELNLEKPRELGRYDRSFSWIKWIKQHNLPIFGKMIYLYGSRSWQQGVNDLLKRYFVCQLVGRQSEFAALLRGEEEGLLLVEDLSMQKALSVKTFTPRMTVLPKGLSDSEIVSFCAQWYLLQLGIVHRSPNEQYILSLSSDLAVLMQDLTKLAEHPNPPPIFLYGPTGVGKNLFINAFHEKAGREGKLISLNCAAIPEQLLESELFGHVKGAFTGAIQDKKGLFELAQGGIVFLDEIGDMPQDLQAKLLHVLQERKVQPIGSSTKIDLDVWITSASKYAMSEMRKRLRDDLFFRLVGVSRTIPPLHERPLDIPLVINYCLLLDVYYTQEYWRVSERWMEGKLAESWPGNVRELVQRVRSEMALAGTPYVLDDSSRKAEHNLGSAQILSQMDTAALGLPNPDWDHHFKKNYRDFKRAIWIEHSRLYFYKLLSQNASQQEAAKQAGLSPSRLSALLKELGVRDFETI